MEHVLAANSASNLRFFLLIRQMITVHTERDLAPADFAVKMHKTNYIIISAGKPLEFAADFLLGIS